MEGGHQSRNPRSIHHTYHPHHSTATSNYTSTSLHHSSNQNSDTPRNTKYLKQTPRGPAPFASFDSIASIDTETTPEEHTTPVNQGK